MLVAGIWTRRIGLAIIQSFVCENPLSTPWKGLKDSIDFIINSSKNINFRPFVLITPLILQKGLFKSGYKCIYFGL